MQQLENVVEDIDRAIFKKCIIFVRECLKTNYFMSTKTGLAFRFAPNVLENKYYPDSPFGIFYIIGKDFRFFHVRWRYCSWWYESRYASNEVLITIWHLQVCLMKYMVYHMHNN